MSRIFILIIGLVGAACSQPPAVDHAAVDEAIRDVLRQYGERINAGEWTASLDLYSDDERFYWAEDGRIAYPTKDAVREGLEGLGASLESTRLTAGDVRVTVLSESHGLAAFPYTQAMRLKSGTEFEFSGVITMTLQKEPGGWRILSGHSSSPRAGGQ